VEDVSTRTRPPVLSPGQRLGHFEIRRLLGAGGMGVVYEAQDLRLERRVALKVLGPDLFRDDVARQRFIREAQLAASITHPNVATIHEVDEQEGRPFIAMELVPGKTVKTQVHSGPLPIREVLSMGQQVCSALQAAHQLGIIHRDIKSSNIIVTPSGQAKVLDFGLAKAFSTAPIDAPSEDSRRGRVSSSPSSLEVEPHGVTSEGAIVGTASYVSPEQASGGPLDARSDIFSLGVVLYEAASGKLPFRGRSDQELLAAIRSEEPTPPRLDRPSLGALSEVIAKCLSKEPEGRYESAADLREELARLQEVSIRRPAIRKVLQAVTGRRTLWVAAALILAALIGKGFFPTGETIPGPALQSIGTIAVLPFENVSNDPNENYLASAVPLELTSRLGQVGALKVIPWTFIKQLRNDPASLQDIRGMTGADAVVEGSVQLQPDQTDGAGKLVHVKAQLFDTRSGMQIWSEDFERDLGDFMSLQANLAQQIAGQIRVKLERREQIRISSSRQVQAEAMELYLRGREAFEERTQDQLNEAVEYFRLAIQRDAQFAEAYVGLADCLLLLTTYFNALDSPAAYREASEATARALEIDSELAEAWASQAFARYLLTWDWEQAELDFKRALELAPNSAVAHCWYADFLSAMGRHAEAIAESRVAEARAPLSPIMSRDVAWAHFFARQYDETLAQLRKTLAVRPDFVPARSLLGRTYLQMGMYDAAIAELEPLGAAYRGMLGQAYAAAGRIEDAERLLGMLTSGSPRDPTTPLAGGVLPYEVVLLLVSLGETDAAFAWLERAFEERDPTLVSLKTDPMLDSIRPDARFDDLLARMSFPP